jgi:hypothetical protein
VNPTLPRASVTIRELRGLLGSPAVRSDSINRADSLLAGRSQDEVLAMSQVRTEHALAIHFRRLQRAADRPEGPLPGHEDLVAALAAATIPTVALAALAIDGSLVALWIEPTLDQLIGCVVGIDTRDKIGGVPPATRR